MEEQYQLKGCENDARLMHSVLVNKFNFAPENIILLLSEDATLAAIHEAMAKVEQALEQDDIFVFHFSGHGGDCTVHEAMKQRAKITVFSLAMIPSQTLTENQFTGRCATSNSVTI
jgi:hypothetical protein